MTVENGDVIRSVARLRTASGDDILNVFHYQYTGPATTDGSVTTAIDTAIDNIYDNIQPAIPSDVSFVDIDHSNVTQGTVFGPHAWPSQTVGGGTGDTMPEQNCANLYGSTRLRHVIGRKFFGPFIEADNADGSWAAGLLAVLADAAVDYLASITPGVGGLLTPGVARYVDGLVDRFTALVATAVSNGVFTQRRRRRGVGA